MQKPSGPHCRSAFRDNYLAAIGIAVFLLASLFADAQKFQHPNDGTWGIGYRRFSQDSTLYFPTSCGAPTDSTWLFSQGGQRLNQFAIYGDSCGHLVYYWDPSAKAWSVFGSGGGSGADSTGPQAFYTLYRSDTSRVNVYGAIALRLIKGDTSYANFLMTRAWGYKIADSIMALVNAALAGKQPTGAYLTAIHGNVAAAGPGDGASVIQPHVVANSMAVQMPAKTVKANITGSTADQADVPIDTLASRITPDSFRIYRKPGSDSVFACVTPVATGVEKCVFQYRDSIGTGGGGGSDSGIAVRNGILKTIAAGTIYMEADSSKYPTVYTMNKIRDSLGNIIGTKAGKMLRWFNAVELHHADSSGVLPARDSIQATINDAYNAGGGVVYLPAGTYKLPDSLRTFIPVNGSNPNSQIYIPLTSLRGANAITVQVRGERPPSFEKSIVTTGYVPPLKGYTVLLSTIKGSGTNPSVIGAADTIFSGQHWNATEVDVQDIIVRTTTKGSGGADTAGTMCGINFLNLTACSMTNVVVDVTSEAFTSVMPNSSTIGILLPHANNSAWNYLSRVQVQGYFTGINMNEHTYADYLFIAACDTAIQLDDMNHDIHIDRVLFNGVVHAIHASNNAYVVVDNFDTEHMLTSCRNVWYAFKDDVSSETTSGLWGSIKYHSVRSCGSAHPEDFTVVNKAANLPIPNLAYSYIGQSPLPYQTVIGNGPITTNPVFHQPKYAGLTISSLWGGAAEWMSGYNPDSTNQFYSTGIFNQKTSKTPYYMLGNKYLGNANMIEFKEYMAKADSTMIQVSDRTPFLHAFLQPLKFSPYSTAGRPTSGIVAGAKIYNTDSVANQTHNGTIWETDATREWVRANSSGAYSLPIAGPSTLGGIKINGGGLSIDGTGLLSVTGGSTPPNSGVGFPIYRPQIPEFFGLGCVGCSWDTTSVLHRLTLTVPSVLGLQSTITANPALTVSNYITGNTKSWVMSAFDSIAFNGNYIYTNQPFNLNAATPTLHFNSSNGSSSYLDISASGSTGEVADNWPSGGFFRTWKVAGTEKMRMNSAGHLKIGIANNSDSLALLHLGPATAALAQIYLAPTAAGPNSTNMKNGFIFRDSVLRALYYRQGDTTYNLVGFKQRGDSLGTGGFASVGHLYKVSDSLSSLFGAPFTDATAIAKNSSDPTKLFRFDNSGITTGTTAIGTIPNFTSFAFAVKDHAQTFTGVQTFTSSPAVPTPTSGTDATNKTYVDGAVAAVTNTPGFQGPLVLVNDADYTVASGKENIIYHATLTANRTVTIPDATTSTNRHIRIYVKNVGGFQLSISSVSQIYLTGTSSFTTQTTNISGSVFDFQSDGTSWYATGYTH